MLEYVDCLSAAEYVVAMAVESKSITSVKKKEKKKKKTRKEKQKTKVDKKTH